MFTYLFIYLYILPNRTLFTDITQTHAFVVVALSLSLSNNKLDLSSIYWFRSRFARSLSLPHLRTQTWLIAQWLNNEHHALTISIRNILPVLHHGHGPLLNILHAQQTRLTLNTDTNTNANNNYDYDNSTHRAQSCLHRYRIMVSGRGLVSLEHSRIGCFLTENSTQPDSFIIIFSR